jgi:hypothetical protein
LYYPASASIVKLSHIRAKGKGNPQKGFGFIQPDDGSGDAKTK